MSRVGKKPIPVPAGVEIKINSDQVTVKGPKGELQATLPNRIKAVLGDKELRAERADEEKTTRALHGLTRALLANAVEGVTTGFSKELDVVGIGYRAEVRGKFLSLSLGHSHPVDFPIPKGIQIKVERLQRNVSNYVGTIVVSGIDKQRVGQIAADLRALRPVDSYKGKGLRYAGELVRLKVGKKGA